MWPYRIRTDHNEDDTLSMLREWSDRVRPLYSRVDLVHEKEWLFADRHPLLMTDERYVHISRLRQEGLTEARRSGVQYLLVRNGPMAALQIGGASALLGRFVILELCIT